MTTSSLVQETKRVDLAAVSEYSKILEHFALQFTMMGSYLTVRTPEQGAGWIIHLSTIISEFTNLLLSTIPILQQFNVGFKIPQNRETAKIIQDGHLGFTQVGKLLTIYPNGEDQAVKLAKLLIKATEGLRGPWIPTDAHLGSVVYTRFGAYLPITRIGSNGEREKYYKDSNSDLIKDEYYIPFKLPENRAWPFSSICKPTVKSEKNIISHKCKILNVIKADARGGVIKGLYLKSLFSVKHCVIKEGRQFMTSDDEGRDIKDRLKWQNQLHQELRGIIPLPKIFDFFEDNGDVFLVMEFVKGISFHNLSQRIKSSGKSWIDLNPAEKVLLLDHFSSILTNISRMHDAGYVHRDITPVNFLIDDGNNVVFIDLELAYNLRSHHPNPPFGYGTPGFVSPEQAAGLTPTLKEDVYGISASLIELFVGLSPLKFDPTYPSLLSENLNFFIRRRPIADVVAGGLRQEPDLRPPISHIQSIIDDYRETIRQEKTPQIEELKPVQAAPEVVRSAIQGAIHSLVCPPVVMKDGLWASKHLDTDNQIANVQKMYSLYPGLFEGVSGVLYILSRCKIAGLDIEPCLHSYQMCLRFLSGPDNASTNLPGGLYRGSAGIAVSVAEGLRAGLLVDNEYSRADILARLEVKTQDLSVATGVAGQGIALLQCGPYLPADGREKLLSSYLKRLAAAQQKDGSWPVDLTSPRKKNTPLLGFGFGVSGITWFLLQYLLSNPDEKVQECVRRSLNWIALHTDNLCNIFQVDMQNQIASPELTNEDEGPAGIILVFIKAYEYFHDPDYRKMAEKALSLYPPFALNNDFAQCSGMAGLGEVYLEAHRVFGDKIWQDRAEWVAQVFLHTRVSPRAKECFWMLNENGTPTADLMTGLAGIIHFLLRFSQITPMGYRQLE
jgi:serine/threonine protein kinase